MKTIGWNILFVSLASFASAQESKRCPPPPLEYQYARLDAKYARQRMFNQGQKVYLKCAEDFTPSRGSRTVECLRTGEWSKPSLKCEKRSCGNAGELPNGQFIYKGDSYIGETVSAVCNKGYTLKGSESLICKKSGWSGERPSCEVGETTCSAPAVANSLTGYKDASVYRVGDSVTFTCRQGFRLAGAQQVTCGPNGQWQPRAPQCLPSPRSAPQLFNKPTQSVHKPTGGCDVPPAVPRSNAVLADKYVTMTTFAANARVQYVCEAGYVAAGGSRYRTCGNGQWSRLNLKCERKSCGSAGEILNGQFTYTGVEFGDKATASCDEGFTLVGKATRNCMSDGWDGRVPECEVAACPEPPQVANAVMVGINEDSYTYRTVVRYRCLVGSLIGEKSIMCKADGTWSAPPTCQEITCPYPEVPNAVWRAPAQDAYQYRETVQLTCRPGFTLSGSQYITCGAEGQWQPTPPKCLPSSDRPTQFPDKPTQLPVKATRLPDKATRLPDKPTQLPDKPTQLPDKPTQLPDKATQSVHKPTGGCDVPPAVPRSYAVLADKYVTMTTFAANTRVQYVCEAGYVAAGGSRYRTCGNGQWSRLNLKCERKSCGSAGEILNGQFTYTGVEFGDKATASCDEGFTLVGKATRNCMSDGWDGRVPECEVAACPEPPQVANAVMVGINEDSYTYRTVVRYRCLVGSLIGEKSIMCKADGTWSAPPTCQEITCPYPEVPNAVWRAPAQDAYQYRETVQLTCRPGFTLSGSQYITCGAEGQWQPTPPKCFQRQYPRSWNPNIYRG